MPPVFAVTSPGRTSRSSALALPSLQPLAVRLLARHVQAALAEADEQVPRPCLRASPPLPPGETESRTFRSHRLMGRPCRPCARHARSFQCRGGTAESAGCGNPSKHLTPAPRSRGGVENVRSEPPLRLHALTELSRVAQRRPVTVLVVLDDHLDRLHRIVGEGLDALRDAGDGLAAGAQRRREHPRRRLAERRAHVVGGRPARPQQLPVRRVQDQPGSLQRLAPQRVTLPRPDGVAEVVLAQAGDGLRVTGDLRPVRDDPPDPAQLLALPG
jgi:hypothetical protein